MLYMVKSGEFPKAGSPEQLRTRLNEAAKIEAWVRAGAPDPRQDPTTTTKAQGPLRGMSIEDGKKWWAFQALHPPAALPTVRDRNWARQRIDNFILAKLEDIGKTLSIQLLGHLNCKALSLVHAGIEARE